MWHCCFVSIFMPQQVKTAVPVDSTVSVVRKLTLRCINVNKFNNQKKKKNLQNICMRQPFYKFQSICLRNFVQFIQTL